MSTLACQTNDKAIPCLNLRVARIGLNARAAIGARRLSVLRVDVVAEHEIVSLSL